MKETRDHIRNVFSGVEDDWKLDRHLTKEFNELIKNWKLALYHHARIILVREAIGKGARNFHKIIYAIINEAVINGGKVKYAIIFNIIEKYTLDEETMGQDEISSLLHQCVVILAQYWTKHLKAIYDDIAGKANHNKLN